MQVCRIISGIKWMVSIHMAPGKSFTQFNKIYTHLLTLECQQTAAANTPTPKALKT
jgi:hypothetical protein